MSKHYVIMSNWSDCCGTDYCEYLGEFENESEAMRAAEDYAWDRWEGPQEYNEDIEDEGPDFNTEVYDPDKHDMLKAGGGSFQDEIW